ncbi:MAG TPA: LPS export ABC transporter permease LptG [Gammaproteobacteria bacterium]|nr:LPS export ABC transporter permease LptG [Gammaproteobacteria bacterium]
MKILDRYLGTTVAGSTLIVMLILLALFFFMDFIDELGDVGKGNYGLLQAMQYVLLGQPRRVYELFPLAALLGSMVGLGWLAGNSELVIIRAAGVSVLQIILSVMRIAVIMMLAVFIIGEMVVPPAEQYAQSQRSIALSDRITLKTDYGFWTRDGRSFINIRNILPGDRLGDIYIYEFDAQHQLRVATHAAKAHFEDNHWVLEDIQQSQVSNDGVTTRTTKRAAWESLLSPELINVVAIKPEKLSTWELHNYINYLSDNGQNTQRYELAFWIKIISPLVTGVMVFLAIPFVFGPLRAVGMGQRIVVGSLVGITFHLFNQTFSQAGLIYDLNPLFSALVPVSVFFALALVLMRKVH